MEILTIILSGLLSLGSSGGLILEQLAQGQIRSQISTVEQQAIRIDNRPNYQILQGKVSQVRWAGRGIQLKSGLRIAALDLATDPIDLDLNKIKGQTLKQLRAGLTTPASAVLGLTLTEVDLNQALQSPEIIEQLQGLLNQLIINKAGSTNLNYQIANPQLDLLSDNRLQISLTLSRATAQIPAISDTSSASNSSRELNIVLSLGLELFQGKQLRLLAPQGTVNGRPMSNRLLQGFAQGIGDRLNLDSLQNNGIFTRILKLKISNDQLRLTGFARLEPKKP